MTVKLALDLPSEARYVRLARMVGRTMLENLNVQRAPAEDIEFVLGELCSNAVRHSQTSGGVYRVTLEHSGDRVSVTVEDRGLGFEFCDVPEAGSLRSDFGGQTRIGGFGMGLVKAFSDKLEFTRTEPQGTTVRVERSLLCQSATAH